MKIYIGLFIIFACLFTAQGKLVFEDNFDTLNFNNWQHARTLAGGGNWEFQIYDNNRTTTFVKDGVLHINPVLTADKIGEAGVRAGYTYDVWGGAPADYCTQNQFYGCSRTSGGNNYINPVMSGKVTTLNSARIKYGRVQVRARLPKGDWLWPAIWLLPAHNQYGGWPASGEIDIMESRGNVGYPSQYGGGPQTVGSTLHWGPDWTANFYEKTHASQKASSGTFADDFHTFGLYWDQNILYTYIDSDSNRVLTVNHGQQSYWSKTGITNRQSPWQYSKNNCAPFDQEYYLILNLAVGGTNSYFPDGVANKPWSDTSGFAGKQFYDNRGQWYSTWSEDSAFRIDSVKIWDLSSGEVETTI